MTPNDSSAENSISADVVVVGGGPAGENVAQYALAGGLSVAIVEKELLGGECSYYACIPSKAMLLPVSVSNASAGLASLTTAKVEPKALLARRNEWVSNYSDAGQMSWAKIAGITVVRGQGKLVGERKVEVSSATGKVLVNANQAVVIATGSSAAIPAAYEEVLPWDSRDVTAVVEIPNRLVIIGGGVVAVEAATWMAALGSEVTLLVRSRILGNQEPFVGELVADGLRASGVIVKLSTSVDSVSRVSPEYTGLGRVHGGEVTLATTDGEIVADEVLVATGRKPRLTDLNLESVNVAAEDITRHSLPTWLHVIGDAGTGAPLTHMGKYEARMLGAKLAGKEEAPAPQNVPVPQVIFSEPQVGSVGLTEHAARAQGFEVALAEVDWSSAAGSAMLRDNPVGRAKVVVDGQTGKLLGATFVGPDAGELVHAATVAIVGEVPVSRLRHAVPSFPTASELWLNLLEALPATLR